MQPIKIMFFDSIAVHVATAEIKKDTSKSVKTLLNMFSKQSIEKMAELMKQKRQKQDFEQSFPNHSTVCT